MYILSQFPLQPFSLESTVGGTVFDMWLGHY